MIKENDTVDYEEWAGRQAQGTMHDTALTRAMVAAYDKYVAGEGLDAWRGEGAAMDVMAGAAMEHFSATDIHVGLHYEDALILAALAEKTSETVDHYVNRIVREHVESADPALVSAVLTEVVAELDEVRDDVIMRNDELTALNERIHQKVASR